MRLMLFTDLDGTLLDHADYSHAAAAEALGRLKALGVPLILASSKTAAEMRKLHAELGLGDWPVIAENGAALVHPSRAGRGDGTAYRQLRAALDALPGDLRGMFRGFGDMTAAEVAATTGLSPEAAALARRREATEPGVFGGPAEALERFTAALSAEGIAARRGGRFLTLSHGATKADRMRQLVAEYRPEATAALGDAPNDVEMIEAADHGFIIRNDHGPGIPDLPGEAEGRIRRAEIPGPAGWNREVLGLLSRMGLDQGGQ